MESSESTRVGYVLKMYPRFSETFILNEMLANQAAGLDFEIFSLRPATDGHFHEALAQIHAPVTYLDKPGGSQGAKAIWKMIGESAAQLPHLLPNLEDALGENVNDVYQALLLARVASARGITHFHAHFASTATSVARLASIFAGLTYSFTAHAKDIFHQNVDHEDLRRKLSGAAAVVTVSDFNYFFLQKTFGSAADQVLRIYNGIDLHQFEYVPPVYRPRRILAVGRLVEKKGFRYLVDACNILSRSGCDYQCEIIGTGALQAELHAHIQALGLENHVRLLGPLPQGEVVRHMREAAAVAVPCVLSADGDRDGLPTVLLEAMAVGTPCVATDVTGIPEVLHNGETGLMIPQHDPAALAAALEKLLDSGDLRVRLARKARELIETQFDLHLNTARLREVITAPTRTTALVSSGE